MCYIEYIIWQRFDPKNQEWFNSNLIVFVRYFDISSVIKSESVTWKPARYGQLNYKSQSCGFFSLTREKKQTGVSVSETARMTMTMATTTMAAAVVTYYSPLLCSISPFTHDTKFFSFDYLDHSVKRCVNFTYITLHHLASMDERNSARCGTLFDVKNGIHKSISRSWSFSWN